MMAAGGVLNFFYLFYFPGLPQDFSGLVTPTRTPVKKRIGLPVDVRCVVAFMFARWLRTDDVAELTDPTHVYVSGLRTKIAMSTPR